MINLDLEKGVKVAKIAKVGEKVSNGDQEFDNVDDALEDIEDEEEEVTLPKDEEEE